MPSRQSLRLATGVSHTALAVTFTAALIGGLPGMAVAAEDESTGSSLPAVTVSVAKPESITTRVNVSGTLVARDEVLVFPQINGYEIQAIDADIGDTVKRGDTLLQLDTQPLEARLAQAEADVSRGEAAIGQARSQIDSAEASLNQAEASLQRSETLRKSGSIPVSTLDESRASALAARAATASAEDGLRVARAQLQQLVAQRDIARLELRRATIKSPVDGVVSVRNAKRGAIASNAGEPLFRIIANGEIELEAELLESALSRIRPGMKAEISIPGVGPRQGEVRLVSPAVDPVTRLGIVKVKLEPDPDIRVGGFASGWLIVDEREVLTVPNSAIEFKSEGGEVTIVRDSVIEKQTVLAGALDGNRREIISGLDEGDQVLTTAGSFYSPGDRVNPVVKQQSADATKGTLQ